MGPEYLGDCPHHVLTVAASPQQRAIPELADKSIQGSGRGAEKLRGHRKIDRVWPDNERLKDLQMPTV